MSSKKKKFTIIAGPCAIEAKEDCFVIAETCKSLCEKYDFPYIFKASYKKANRTASNSFRGVGLEKGLKILAEIKEKFSVPVLTDIHETKDVQPTSSVVDILQIPAFLSRQTELIEEAARTGRIINIKKAQFMSANGAKHAYDKAINAGASEVFITERGTFFGYNDLVVDFRNFKLLDSWGIPVIYDVTHSLQRPSIDETSGGSPEFVMTMASAAIATGHLSGLFIETHPEPSRAKSDARSMLPLNELERVLQKIRKLLDLS
ncbi:MAG: 3-deoxy-8-phosphooctulonate synthase [Candidatus Cloacimonetes bacterium]|nr:3-deoxy-8-phosphooctulonate synthase [Candidatus Cloacimonadota bacterium]